MVDYWQTDISQNPRCSHGPSLLFSRKGNDRKFYVCSAFRDRKECPFFLWQDEANSRIPRPDGSFDELISTFNAHRNRVLELTRKHSKKSYCCTCEMLISTKEHGEHTSHDLKKISDDVLRYPTLVMKPKQQTRGESQFHFSESTIKSIYNFLLQLNLSAVACIGCPSIHEFALNKEDCHIESLLLDIDYRFLQFYEGNRFQVFNMFNCHMFDSEGWNKIRALYTTGKSCIVIDPPFGGRIETLAYTLNRLQAVSNTDLTILLILPYFMEPAVLQSLPSFSMLDYKVEYENHRQFKKRTDTASNRGSAVRIFTNASPKLFVLPREEGYKYCDMCERWVCKENNHCFKCEACTSKNGGAYRHCDRCGKCVKKTWRHCSQCGICKLPDHVCKEGCLKRTAQHEVRENSKKRKCNKRSRKKKLKTNC